jgi:predicted metalloprotease
MRWSGRRQSTNIEDRRGLTPGKAAGGLGGIGIVIAIAYALLTGDTAVLNQISTTGTGPPSPNEAEYKEFAAVTLADTEQVWSEIFGKSGETYRPPTMVLFNGAVESACGFASAAVGPFYCGEDYKVYLDLGFFDQMKAQLGARGDFAQAYVIAHEVGHHVQKLLGTLDKVHSARQRMNERESNELSVRLELQADFYAGIWAHHAKEMAGIDRQDIQEGIEAAKAIGDDTLQKRSQGYVVPDAFTHGSSEQRMRWFMRGFETGDPNQGDTFNIARP